MLTNFNSKKCIFLREHFNSKRKKLNTNYSASKAKTCQCSGLVKPILNKKCVVFGLYFSFASIFANTLIKNPQFNLFYQYMLLLTGVKQFSKLLNKKRNKCYFFSCNFSIRYVNGFPESKNLSVKYPYTQLRIQTFQFYMES